MNRIPVAALAIALCGSVAVAQSADEAAVKDTAARFLTAISKGDKVEAAALFAGGKDDKALVDAFVSLPPAVKSLRAAVTGKFGVKGADDLKIADMNPADQIAKIKTSPVQINGDTANLVIPGNPGGMSFKRDAGRWKLTSLTANPELTDVMTDMITGVHGVIEASAADIAAGKFATLDDVRKSMEARAQAVLTPVLPRLDAIGRKAAAGDASTKPTR